MRRVDVHAPFVPGHISGRDGLARAPIGRAVPVRQHDLNIPAKHVANHRLRLLRQHRKPPRVLHERSNAQRTRAHALTDPSFPPFASDRRRHDVKQRVHIRPSSARLVRRSPSRVRVLVRRRVPARPEHPHPHLRVRQRINIHQNHPRHAHVPPFALVRRRIDDRRVRADVSRPPKLARERPLVPIHSQLPKRRRGRSHHDARGPLLRVQLFVRARERRSRVRLRRALVVDRREFIARGDWNRQEIEPSARRRVHARPDARARVRGALASDESRVAEVVARAERHPRVDVRGRHTATRIFVVMSTRCVFGPSSPSPGAAPMRKLPTSSWDRATSARQTKHDGAPKHGETCTGSAER